MTSAASRRSSTEAAAVCLAFVLLAGAGPAKAAAAPVPPRDAGAEARSILQDAQYQSRLPVTLPEPGEMAGGHIRRPRSGDVVPADPGEQEEGFQWPHLWPHLPDLSGLILALLYLGLAAGIAIGIVLAVRYFLHRRRHGVAPAAVPETEIAEEGERRTGRTEADDAERLAAAGRWDEALHMLLLQAIRGLSRRLPAPPPPSATSRELLRLVPLPGEARQAFAGLVRAVELSLFGGAPVGPAEYRENRERYRAVAAALAGGHG